MTEKQSEKWYGKIAYRSEGVVNYVEGSKEKCEAYVKGFKLAQSQTADYDDDPLEDFVTSVDQIEMVDE